MQISRIIISSLPFNFSLGGSLENADRMRSPQEQLIFSCTPRKVSSIVGVYTCLTSLWMTARLHMKATNYSITVGSSFSWRLSLGRSQVIHIF
jgi:hypothetical protein